MKALLNFRAEVNLVQETVLQSMGIPYTVDMRLCLVDINGDETVLRGICENIEVRISPVSVLQFLLIVENFSQPLVLGMPYAIATSMVTKSHPSGIVDIEITSPDDRRKVQFQGSRPGSKMKYLSQLFPTLGLEQGKD